MKQIKLLVLLALYTGATLNGAALSALRGGRTKLQQTASYLSHGSMTTLGQPSMPSMPMHPSTVPSILQPRGFSTVASPLYVSPMMTRLYGQRTNGQTGSEQQGRYSSKQVAAALLGLGIGATALATKVEDTHKHNELQFNKLYATYAAPYGSVEGLLRRENIVKTKIVLARVPETVAIDLANLIAKVKDADAGALFTDPQAVSSVSMIAAASAQAEQILVDRFAHLLNNGSFVCCTSDAQKNLFNQFVDADTDGSYALKLATALPWPKALGSSAQSWYTLLKEDADIAKTKKWQGGWWSGKYVMTGEEQASAHHSLLRRLAAKHPQAAQEITDRIIAQAQLKGFKDIPFFTLAFLVNNSPYAAQKFAQYLPESVFMQMVEHQNIAQEAADAVWQELQAAPATGRLQE